jgi:hypothetical protein
MSSVVNILMSSHNVPAGGRKRPLNPKATHGVRDGQGLIIRGKLDPLSQPWVFAMDRVLFEQLDRLDHAHARQVLVDHYTQQHGHPPTEDLLEQALSPQRIPAAVVPLPKEAKPRWIARAWKRMIDWAVPTSLVSGGSLLVWAGTQANFESTWAAMGPHCCVGAGLAWVGGGIWLGKRRHRQRLTTLEKAPDWVRHSACAVGLILGLSGGVLGSRALAILSDGWIGYDWGAWVTQYASTRLAIQNILGEKEGEVITARLDPASSACQLARREMDTVEGYNQPRLVMILDAGLERNLYNRGCGTDMDYISRYNQLMARGAAQRGVLESLPFMANFHQEMVNLYQPLPAFSWCMATREWPMDMSLESQEKACAVIRNDVPAVTAPVSVKQWGVVVPLSVPRSP